MNQPSTVRDVLRTVPSHGWVGRRDRALLVLSQLAGLSYLEMAGLSTTDVSITGGVATIRTPTATMTLEASEDTLLCGPCALARWLHLLEMTVSYPDSTVPAAVLARGPQLISGSPHACQTPPHTDDRRPVTLLPAVDPWGILAPRPGTRLPRQHRPATTNHLWQAHRSPADLLERRTEQLLGTHEGGDERTGRPTADSRAG